MNISTPTVVEYAARPYVALRRQVVMPIGPTATKTMEQLTQETRKQNIQGTGAAVFRYNIVVMPGLDMEFGFETQTQQATVGELHSSVLPAGRYANLTYVGPYRHLVKVNGALIDWCRANGLTFDMHSEDDGDHFASRVEFFPNGPLDEPDENKLETIVAIKLKG